MVAGWARFNTHRQVNFALSKEYMDSVGDEVDINGMTDLNRRKE
jgi:hypothetical protein